MLAAAGCLSTFEPAAGAGAAIALARSLGSVGEGGPRREVKGRPYHNQSFKLSAKDDGTPERQPETLPDIRYATQRRMEFTPNRYTLAFVPEQAVRQSGVRVSVLRLTRWGAQLSTTIDTSPLFTPYAMFASVLR